MARQKVLSETSTITWAVGSKSDKKPARDGWFTGRVVVTINPSNSGTPVGASVPGGRVW